MPAPILVIRPARLDDAKLLWDWSNDPQVRAMAFDAGRVPWDQHETWLRDRLADDRSLLMILETTEGAPVGQCRFDVVPEGQEVDFSITADCRGRGWGVRLLQEAMRLARRRLSPETRLIARVLALNERSLAVCRRAGFAPVEIGMDDGRRYVRMERRLGAEITPA